MWEIIKEDVWLQVFIVLSMIPTHVLAFLAGRLSQRGGDMEGGK